MSVCSLMALASTCDRGEVYSHQQSEVGGDVIDQVGLVMVVLLLWVLDLH